MNPIQQFEDEKTANIAAQGNDPSLAAMGIDFLVKTHRTKYSYNFSWMGRPIIAYPQDMLAMQELIWSIKPDLIIETGVAHGGSIVYYASLLELIGGDGLVVGIDIDIRKHNRDLIEAHPMMKRIKLIEGSSVGAGVMAEVKTLAAASKRVMICLDSNHTHDHVLEELRLYHPLVTSGSYLVVFDTVVEDMPADWDWSPRDWGVGNNPKTAVRAFLKENSDFEVNSSIDHKLLISVAPGGYLRRK